jgi:hypothetical protein
MTRPKPIAIEGVNDSWRTRHAENRRHARVDVGDDGRPDRPISSMSAAKIRKAAAVQITARIKTAPRTFIGHG